MIWRIWKDKGVPLQELRWDWTYEDLLKANAVLDMDAAIQVAYDEAMKEELKK